MRKIRFKCKFPLSSSFRILFIKIGKYTKVGVINSQSLSPMNDSLIFLWKTV